MGSISRTEQFLLVSGVLTTGLIIRATAACQIGSPGNDNQDFSSSGVGVCFDGIGGDDTIIGSDHADTLTGGGGGDSICGGDEGDLILGEGGTDYIEGEGGRDTITGASGSDPSLGGGDDPDDITAGGLDDGIDGGAQGDEIEGNAGADSVVAEGGPDTVYGGNGADVLRSGLGTDQMWDFVDASPYASDDKADVFCTNDGSGTDTIHIGTEDSVDADGGDSIHVYDSLGTTPPLFSGPFDDGSANDYESSAYYNPATGC